LAKKMPLDSWNQLVQNFAVIFSSINHSYN
jgi:hypothetical protein